MSSNNKDKEIPNIDPLAGLNIPALGNLGDLGLPDLSSLNGSLNLNLNQPAISTGTPVVAPTSGTSGNNQDISQLLAGIGNPGGNLIPNLDLNLNPFPLGLQPQGSGGMNMFMPPAAGLGGLGVPGLMNFGIGQLPVQGLGPGMASPQLVPGSQAHQNSFHVKGPDNEIKLFVGGLAFQTVESNLIEYFKQYGIVIDAIVMRDRATSRGRGFGFVKMQFENQEKAQENKLKLLSINSDKGHYINDKRVDVKSADDYVKGQTAPTRIAENLRPNLMQQPWEIQQQQLQENGENPLVPKPNPYVIVEAADSKNGESEKKEVVYKYPKSKIFVGGLDFKLENEHLKQHFQQWGEIENAVILKNINNGQSRGFGFVTFKDEAVAQELILNKRTTNILGRKVDIKSAEPKFQSSNQGMPPSIPTPGYRNTSYKGDSASNGFAMIPQYGGGGRSSKDNQSDDSQDDSSRDSKYRKHRSRHHSRWDHHDRPSRRRRSDSGDSRDSSSDHRRKRDRRGPHHGSKVKSSSKPSRRSRSRSNK